MSERYGGVSVPEPGRPGKDDLDRLLAAVARGEHGAFDLVYEQLSGPVYAAVRDPGHAEEVTQEVPLEI